MRDEHLGGSTLGFVPVEASQHPIALSLERDAMGFWRQSNLGAKRDLASKRYFDIGKPLGANGVTQRCLELARHGPPHDFVLRSDMRGDGRAMIRFIAAVEIPRASSPEFLLKISLTKLEQLTVVNDALAVCRV